MADQSKQTLKKWKNWSTYREQNDGIRQKKDIKKEEKEKKKSSGDKKMIEIPTEKERKSGIIVIRWV